MYENEKIKKEFLEYLRGAEGFDKSSVNAFAQAIGQWQQFTGNKDFATFNKTTALEFRESLVGRVTKTKAGKLTIPSQYHYLRRLKKFFSWLPTQPRYKNIRKADVEYLRMSNNDARIARAGSTRAKPTLEDAKKIIGAIQGNTEIDRRDRALISLAVITGCRVSALVTLKMKSFDKKRLVVNQNPADGVHTKNSKTIPTPFFPIGWDAPKKYFLEWYEYLEQKGFQPDDPIFPASEAGIGVSAHSKERVGHIAWSGSDGARKIFQKRCENADVLYFNPHSFRHLVVGIQSTKPLTERQKRAISQCLGHENVGTTFGAYGYGKMSDEEAIDEVKELERSQGTGKGHGALSDDDVTDLERILGKLKGTDEL